MIEQRSSNEPSSRSHTMTARSVAATGQRTAAAGYPRRWLAAIVIIIGALMDMIDVTIVNVALPTIRRDLHASATQLEWVVSGYMLAFAAALIIAGNLGDLFGRKRVFLTGVAVFGLASLAAGLSQTGAELITARVVQGIAAAAMTPQVLATFRAIFTGAERGKAFGIYGAMLGFASAVGLLLGGVLTDANLFGWSWRSVFFVNVPVAIGALIAGVRCCWPGRWWPWSTRCSKGARRAGPRGSGCCWRPGWPGWWRSACSRPGGPPAGATDGRPWCARGCSGSRRSRPGSGSRWSSRRACRDSSWPSRCGCRPASTSRR